MDDSKSSIQMSSSDPPHKDYFKYYKVITIDHNQVNGTVDHKNFPVLISILDSDLHDDVQLNGNDIAFANDTTWLDHEIELFDQAYNSTHAQLVAWVRIPELSTSLDTYIRMYYGNSTMGSRQNPIGVWDASYKGVWHLAESVGVTEDSTSYNENGIISGTIIRPSIGQIGNAYNYGINGNFNVGDPADGHLDFGTESFMVSFWINIDTSTGNWQLPLYKGATSIFYPGYCFETPPTGDSLSFHITDGSNNIGSPSANITFDSWAYIVGMVDRTNELIHIYKNGTEIGSGTDISSILSIDGDEEFQCANPTYDFDGLLDEVRVLNITRSKPWIKTEYNNQYDPSSFYSIGKEYPTSSNPPNDHYFKYHKEIIIDHSMVSGSNDLINFPLLISTFDEDLRNKAQEDGDDIAFAYNGVWLDHEIEIFNQFYNSSHAQLITWVSIPRLSSSEDTVVRIYYGNSSMGSQENPTGVWSDNYLGVWHLSESSGSAEDSTSYGTSGIPSGTVTRGVLGQIGNSYYFDRDGLGTVNMGNPVDGHLDFTDNEDFTIEFWLNLEYFYYYSPFLVSKREGISSSAQGYCIQVFDDENGIALYEISSNYPEFGVDGTTSLLNTGWHHVVCIFNEDSESDSTIYIDGVDDKTSTFGNIGDIDDFDNDLNFRLNGRSTTSKSSMMDGKMDEVRVSNVVRSPDWIRTEYDNQKDPTSFFTVGPEEKFDVTPPTYSNLIESSDPLELGNNEIITINVTDPFGINQVLIEFEGNNLSMTNIMGDLWQNDSWTPKSVGNYTYTIWMEDNYNNWNSTVGTIEVIDTTPPTYSDLIESADPLQLGQNETITIKIYDSPGSGVNQVLLEYESSNHTMSFIGGNTWSWGKWKPAIGNHSYTIYMQDMENNWNMTSGTIDVVSTTAPVIENLTKSAEYLELGDSITIFVDVFDNESISTVFIELESVNYTMNAPQVGNTYNYTWARSWTGTVIYKIYANDTFDSWNSLTSSFDIVDTTPPAFSDLVKSEDPLEFGDMVIISVNSTDLANIKRVLIESEELDNETMVNIGGDTWQYALWSPSAVGNRSYTIWAEDNNSNWGFLTDSILVQDTILPVYSDLTESANPVELGDSIIISINCTDLAAIKDVSIEFENSTHPMENIGGDIWQYIYWMPHLIGNYTYTIYITDNNDNLNNVSSSILFQDTIIPVYSNVFENADPLELGDTQIIRINIYDFAGINQSLIEFEGANHSMTNIYGDTWQFDSWTPNNWIVYQYRINMEDKSGNWNFLIGNITVHDTTPPSPPVMTNAPSGDVSGILTFDWIDGFDESGISMYRLIIDFEIDPFTTPGLVFDINITNTGPSSSYYEYTESLQPGTYYFFLWQTDGAGHQSYASMGSFSIISSSQPFPFWIIFISIIIISVLASLTVRSYVILPRKRRKESELSARTQRFKDLRNIQAIIIIHKLSGIPIFSKSYSILEKNQNELFSGFIQAITVVSEEFSENESVDTERVEKIIELELKYFNCLIADEEHVRVAFILKQKSSKRLKSHARAFIMKLNLSFYEELQNWDGSLNKFQSLIPSILNEYFELYYKEPFIITDAASKAKICKDHELSSMENHILNITDSIMKDETSFYLYNIIKLVDEQNENLVIDALESLIKKGLILPADK